jgi:hypothetical protein
LGRGVPRPGFPTRCVEDRRVTGRPGELVRGVNRQDRLAVEVLDEPEFLVVVAAGVKQEIEVAHIQRLNPEDEVRRAQCHVGRTGGGFQVVAGQKDLSLRLDLHPVSGEEERPSGLRDLPGQGLHRVEPVEERGPAVKQGWLKHVAIELGLEIALGSGR